MNVTAYIHIYRTNDPTTGVGKHIINMTRGLAACDDVNLTYLASRDTLTPAGQIPPASRIAGMPVKSFPLPLRLMEQFWRRLDFPAAERFTPNADWVYCPAEAYVTTRSARLAVTIHDVAAFEPDLPWSNTPQHQRFRRSFSLMFQRLKQHATVFLTVSEFTRNRLCELLSIDPERVAVVGNGVEEAYFQPAPASDAWNPGKPDPYILLVGGVNARKGGEQIIRFAQTLLDRKSPLRIHVAGLHDAPLLNQAAKLDNVTNLGFITDAQLLTATRGAAMSMLLSRYEGFGIPALEAMAAGVPAIISPHTALPEIAGDGGIIVQPEDPAAIADVCHRLIEDPAYREQIISRGHTNAAKYHWSDCVRRLHETLRRFS